MITCPRCQATEFFQSVTGEYTDQVDFKTPVEPINGHVAYICTGCGYTIASQDGFTLRHVIICGKSMSAKKTALSAIGKVEFLQDFQRTGLYVDSDYTMIEKDSDEHQKLMNDPNVSFVDVSDSPIEKVKGILCGIN